MNAASVELVASVVCNLDLYAIAPQHKIGRRSASGARHSCQQTKPLDCPRKEASDRSVQHQGQLTWRAGTLQSLFHERRRQRTRPQSSLSHPWFATWTCMQLRHRQDTVQDRTPIDAKCPGDLRQEVHSGGPSTSARACALPEVTGTASWRSYSRGPEEVRQCVWRYPENVGLTMKLELVAH
jgi:hypothetical protein